MNLRSLVKAVTPPILLDIVRGKQAHGCSGCYASYDEACKTITGYGSIDGYEESDLINVIYLKTIRFRDAISSSYGPVLIDMGNIRTILALSLAIKGDEFRVIDFGGACGAHYFSAKALYGEKVKFKWHVVETENMVNQGKSLQTDELNFYTDVDSARQDMGHVDMIFSSGALQYVRNPYQSLQKLLECDAKYIFLTRWGLSNSNKDLFTVQASTLSMNGIGPLPEGIKDKTLKYPVTIVRKEVVEDFFLTRHYRIEIQFNEDQGAYVVDGCQINMYGFFGIRSPLL